MRDELEGEMLLPVTVGAKRDANSPRTSNSDLPDEYRENLSPLAWEQEARNREYRDEAFKETVPEDKRELIRLLER